MKLLMYTHTRAHTQSIQQFSRMKGWKSLGPFSGRSCAFVLYVNLLHLCSVDLFMHVL